MALEEKDIIAKLYKLSQKISSYTQVILDLEAKDKNSSRDLMKLKKYRKKLQECLDSKEELSLVYQSIINKKMKDRLAIKTKSCKELLDEVTITKIIYNEKGEEIVLSEELKSAFIAELQKYMSSSSLSHTFIKEVTDNYSIEEGFVMNSNGKIDIRLTINDFTIAAKHHTHFTTIDEMLLRYQLYLNDKKSKKKTL